MKVKWDIMGEKKKEKPGTEEVAFKILLGEEACKEIDDEIEEDHEILEAETRTIFSRGNMSFDFSKRRATDMKGSSRGGFPPESQITGGGGCL